MHTYRILVGKHEGKNNKGDLRWENNIKMSLIKK
jgi:hypothetical protein